MPHNSISTNYKMIEQIIHPSKREKKPSLKSIFIMKRKKKQTKNNKSKKKKKSCGCH